MTSGQLVLNGISDKEIVKIFQRKEKHEGSFQFNPQQMQTASLPQPGGKPLQVYNNVVLTWNSHTNSKIVLEVLQGLVEEPESVPA